MTPSRNHSPIGAERPACESVTCPVNVLPGPKGGRVHFPRKPPTLRPYRYLDCTATQHCNSSKSDKPITHWQGASILEFAMPAGATQHQSGRVTPTVQPGPITDRACEGERGEGIQTAPLNSVSPLAQAARIA